MDSIRSVLLFCVKLLNTRLSFSPFSFTVYQYFLALAVLGLAVWFFKRLFS